eukprot:10799132-Alexandrium_andersonii.AAC.1
MAFVPKTGAFIPTRAQLVEALDIREQAVRDTMEVFEDPREPCWSRPAALFPGERTFWTLLGGLRSDGPYYEVVYRLRM